MAKDPRSKILFVRLHPWERDAITAAADAREQSVSEFVRLTMLDEAERRLVTDRTGDAGAER